ncbi:MAG: alpha/beta fold hydrolase, partial [Candidatus Methylumidiphilus sp.]
MVDQKLAQTFCLRDGRLIGYAEFGDPEGFPVVYCHGFPASRLEGGLLDAAARRQRVRVIAADRPGYGLSAWQADRAMTDWPDDISQLLAHLGIERFAVLGVSGGGPYGLSLLAKLADRVVAASFVCPLGPVYQPELVQAMHWPARLGFVSA